MRQLLVYGCRLQAVRAPSPSPRPSTPALPLELPSREAWSGLCDASGKGTGNTLQHLHHLCWGQRTRQPGAATGRGRQHPHSPGF